MGGRSNERRIIESVTIGEATLYCADATFLETLKFDCVVSDPPATWDAVDIINRAIEHCRSAVIYPGFVMMDHYRPPDTIGFVILPNGDLHVPVSYYRCTGACFMSDPQPPDVRHVAVKPLNWMLNAVEACSKEGDTVCDPFMGSGTTGIACIALGRRFIGVEIEPRYFDIACERILKASSALAAAPRSPDRLSPTDPSRNP